MKFRFFSGSLDPDHTVYGKLHPLNRKGVYKVTIPNLDIKSYFEMLDALNNLGISLEHTIPKYEK